MRCRCCNKNLSDYEATVKHKETGEYLDLCNPCRLSVMSMSPFEVQDRPDLMDEYLSDEEGFDESEFVESTDIGYNDTLEGDSRAD